VDSPIKQEFTMEEKTESEAGTRARRLRADHRTGKPVLLRDAGFWQEHERRRLEQGLSMPAYCKANGLAISTYRYRMNPSSRKSAVRTGSAKSLPKFVAVQAPVAAAMEQSVEVLAGEMTLRLHGTAAETVLQRVLEKLA
jgi:hypothetical protein